MKQKTIPQEHDQIAQLLETIDTKEGLVSLCATFMNTIMQKEREIYLRQQSENKANGFYDRSVSTGLGSLPLAIPRDRDSLFRSVLLPERWKRSDISYDNLLTSLVMQSYSPNKIKSLLTDLQLPYSPEQIEELRDELYEKAKEFKNRQLPADFFAILIDAYHTDVKDEQTSKVQKAVIYTVMGISLSGKKDILGYYQFYGSETKEDWLIILNNLISRGLKRIMLIISDDFSGLADAINVLFSRTDHQLCFVHFLRNVKRNMSKDDAAVFIEQIQILRKATDFDSAIEQFAQLAKRYEKKYPAYIKHIAANAARYFIFLKYPRPVQKHIYTTNGVENFNSRLEVLRTNMGGYFQSPRTIDVAVYVLISRLLLTRWKKAIPAFESCKYEITQCFNSKFAYQTKEV